jgi:hypothetical protein
LDDEEDETHHHHHQQQQQQQQQQQHQQQHDNPNSSHTRRRKTTVSSSDKIIKKQPQPQLRQPIKQPKSMIASMRQLSSKSKTSKRKVRWNQNTSKALCDYSQQLQLMLKKTGHWKCTIIMVLLTT